MGGGGPRVDAVDRGTGWDALVYYARHERRVSDDRVAGDVRLGVTMAHMSASGPIVPLLFGLVLVGCARTSRAPDESDRSYVVTVTPIEVGVGSGLCIAVDLNDPGGVWWWQPGNDCSKRTSGVVPAEQGMVAPGPKAGTADIHFRVQVHRAPNAADPPYVDVRLALKDGRLGSPGRDSWVDTVTRRDLEIPEMWR